MVNLLGNSLTNPKISTFPKRMRGKIYEGSGWSPIVPSSAGNEEKETNQSLRTPTKIKTPLVIERAYCYY